ncbi:MAG: MBL fold metallo-hydrolase [bacterium]|nr:MBL fold metallo-hydrolase [bacterium]
MIDVTHPGHSCFRLKGKNVTLLIDPYSQEETGLSFEKMTADAVLCTHKHADHHDLSRVSGYRVLIDAPGEYEVGGAQILGVPSFHDGKNGAERGVNIIYQIEIDGVTFVHLGDLGTKLDDGQISLLSSVEVLMIPVGGICTIDAAMATEVIAQLEPKIVIPMHYSVPELKFVLDPLEKFLKGMEKEDLKPQPKLSLSAGKLSEETQVVVLG